MNYNEAYEANPLKTSLSLLAPDLIKAWDLPSGTDSKSAFKTYVGGAMDVCLLGMGAFSNIGKAKGLASASEIMSAESVIEATRFSEAYDSINALKLRNRLIGEEIAGGHAYAKHVIDQGEFKGLIHNPSEFAKHIENIITNPTESKKLGNGKFGFWHEPSKTVVIKNPHACDGGTSFQPTNGKMYYDTLPQQKNKMIKDNM